MGIAANIKKGELIYNVSSECFEIATLSLIGWGTYRPATETEVAAWNSAVVASSKAAKTKAELNDSKGEYENVIGTESILILKIIK